MSVSPVRPNDATSTSRRPLDERRPAPADPSGKSLTVVIPAFNEAENLVTVVPDTIEVLRPGYEELRVLVVDDGSTDGTRGVMEDLLIAHPEVAYIRLRRNFGKSEALRVGFDAVDTDLVALMDADGQDDPRELHKLRSTLDSGVDQVTGRRALRHDRFVKRQTSKLYNGATQRITGVEGRDFNSGLKLMRREVAETIDLYGELHRYIPVLAAWAGFRVAEADVEHHSRLYGSSKFGRSRFWRGFFDLITVKFLTTYTTRPFHLFGGAGFLIGAAGAALLTWMLAVKLTGASIGNRPALSIGVLLVVVGVQVLSLGLIGELFVHHRRVGDIDSVADRRGWSSTGPR
jgi:glycosyltransferase involved in cell wall biosynthesis